MFRCAWVCLNMLRRTGCALPVELWALNGAEIDPRMKVLAAGLNARFVNASRVRAHHPVRILNAWELKPYAIIHSRFRHVLLLDADNVPLHDPTTLFDSRTYRDRGAIFWPDRSAFSRNHPIWRICRLSYRSEPRVESGQMAIDKLLCWRPLQLAMFMNEHSDFFYRHIHGDKDTFQLAWRLCDQRYAMPRMPMRPLNGAMCQYDLRGRRMFQHRLAKWDDPALRIGGFLQEGVCRRILQELNHRLRHA